MQYKELTRDAFFWALQGVCALHRKPFSPELAQQQLATPHTVQSLVGATQACGFDAALRKTKPGKLHKESFPPVQKAVREAGRER